MEAEWADHWFAIGTAEKRSSWLSGSAGISVLAQVGLALQEPSPHARDSSLTVVAAPLPTGFSDLATFLPGSRYQSQEAHCVSQHGRSAWLDEEEAQGVLAPEVL